MCIILCLLYPYPIHCSDFASFLSFRTRAGGWRLIQQDNRTMKENDGCSGTAVAPRSLMSRSGTFKFNPSYSASAAKTNVDLSTSLSDEGGRSSTSSCQHGDRRQEKLILLKRSVQYTTQLKSDTMTMTNEETPNSLQCKDIESDEITDCNDPTSSPSMFDISTTRPSHPFQENT